MVGQFLATLGQVGRCCVRAIVVNPHARVATAAGRGLPALPADFFAQADRFVITPASVPREDRIHSGG